jgi:hypothetical protein
MMSCGMSVLLSHVEFILRHILEIEFIEMREPAVPAADGKMPASYHNIMEADRMTVSATCGFFKVPDIITPNLCKCARLRHILDTGDKDPGRTAVVTRHFSLVGDSFNDLIGNLSAMVAVSSIPGKNKLVAHAKYWMRRGSLICCRTCNGCGPGTIKQ